jgi:hypothetical protein
LRWPRSRVGVEPPVAPRGRPARASAEPVQVPRVAIGVSSVAIGVSGNRCQFRSGNRCRFIFSLWQSVSVHMAIGVSSYGNRCLRQSVSVHIFSIFPPAWERPPDRPSRPGPFGTALAGWRVPSSRPGPCPNEGKGTCQGEEVASSQSLRPASGLPGPPPARIVRTPTGRIDREADRTPFLSSLSGPLHTGPPAEPNRSTRPTPRSGGGPALDVAARRGGGVGYPRSEAIRPPGGAS